MSLTAAVAMGQRSLAPDAYRGTLLTAVDDHNVADRTLIKTLLPGSVNIHYRQLL
jgi:hypothetical protein